MQTKGYTNAKQGFCQDLSEKQLVHFITPMGVNSWDYLW